MRFAVSMQILLIEERGVFDSLSRSGMLTAGKPLEDLPGRFDHVSDCGGAVCGIHRSLGGDHHDRCAEVPRGAVWLQIVTAIAGGLGGVITGPLLAITMALIYYDLRIRKEGFDIEAAMIQTQTPAIVSGEVAPPAL